MGYLTFLGDFMKCDLHTRNPILKGMTGLVVLKTTKYFFRKPLCKNIS